MKFKPGDKVIVTKQIDQCNPEVGYLTEIVDVAGPEVTIKYENGWTSLTLGDDLYWFIDSNLLELYNPNQEVLPYGFEDHKLKVKVKKLDPNAVLPTYAKLGDAGMDLTAVSKEYDGDNIVFGTGLSIELPENHVALLFPRSSICKIQLTLSNAVGVIDSGYRGEIKAVFRTGERPSKNYEVGDRIIQMLVLPYPKIEIVEVDTLSDTERGTNGFGSSGK